MVEDILGQIGTGGLEQIGSQLGVDSSQASDLVSSALPALLGGLSQNSATPDGASALLGALGKHQAGSASSTDLLGGLDLDDGQKILGHVLGGNQEAVVNHIAGGDRSKGSMLMQLLPILAPLVMQWLAGRQSGDGLDAGGLGGLLAGEAKNTQAGGIDIGGILDMLGGGSGGGAADILGDVLGGATGRSTSSGGLMGALKKMLGG